MTYEEAIFILEEVMDDYRPTGGCEIAFRKALASLEKQIPKKPIKVKKHYKCECGVWLLYDDEIPNENDSYCPRCGQAIDWSDV